MTDVRASEIARVLSAAAARAARQADAGRWWVSEIRGNREAEVALAYGLVRAEEAVARGVYLYVTDLGREVAAILRAADAEQRASA